MDYKALLKNETNIIPISIASYYKDEVYIKVRKEEFSLACMAMHKTLNSPVMMFFASDERKKEKTFRLYCNFEDVESQKWVFITTEVDENNLTYDSLSREIYSAALFEREIKDMFGLSPAGNPDTRHIFLHEETCPEGNYPLRKDFKKLAENSASLNQYIFAKIDGEGIFEIPVGPVHAGVIGPGHFRFSVAGEPIIKLELRLGFTHKGVEKLFENKPPEDCVGLSECISGDSSFAHSSSFCSAVEKILSINVPANANYLRNVFLELERLYNHASDIGGIATDVGFSYPAAYAAIIKESILALNEQLAGHRYLKGINVIGGVLKGLDDSEKQFLLKFLKDISSDFNELEKMLFSSVSFMDRVDTTGRLDKEIAEDIGVVGLAARASGIPKDLRKDFPGYYSSVNFRMVSQLKGDVLSRLTLRIEEFKESINLIRQFIELCDSGDIFSKDKGQKNIKYGLGYTEGWRGPVLYWIKLNESGFLDRCKIVDPSFHNWSGLTYAVMNNIIPDFPLCNKSFNLSYSGNDL